MARDSKVATILKEHIVKVNTAADHILGATNDWQMIKAYLGTRVHDIKLNAFQQGKLERYQFIYNQLVSGRYTDREVVEANMKMFKVEQRQSYNDISCTREIFSSTININKKFEIDLQLQVNRRMLRKAEEMADFKAYAQLEKNRATLLSMVEEIEETGDNFEGHVYQPMFDPQLIGAETIDMKEVLQVINEGRKVKINTKLFEDLDYEETK